MYEQITSNKRRTILIAILFIVFVVFLGWFFGYVLGFQGFFPLAIIISLITTTFSYFAGDKVALWTAGAQPIARENNLEVYRLVENLCITAGLPMPKIYMINDAAPNAFATGRDPKHASLALTSGIVSIMTKEELEGVIAHELSHVRNYDIRVMTIIIVLVGTVALISDWFLRSMFFGGFRRRGRNNDEGGAIMMVFFVIGLVLAILSPLIAKLIQLAISRRREFLADASGALLTRYPEGLASALEKIEAYKQPMLHANNATAHLYISNPFGATAGFISKMFSTHPPIEERIKVLRSMAQ